MVPCYHYTSYLKIILFVVRLSLNLLRAVVRYWSVTINIIITHHKRTNVKSSNIKKGPWNHLQITNLKQNTQREHQLCTSIKSSPTSATPSSSTKWPWWVLLFRCVVEFQFASVQLCAVHSFEGGCGVRWRVKLHKPKPVAQHKQDHQILQSLVYWSQTNRSPT